VTNPPDDRGAELRELFFETSQELLQALNEESLKLEKNPGDEEIVRSIRRTVHTLKGDSAACGLRELSELAHHFEDALTMDAAAGHGALAEIALAAADVFTAMLAAYHSGGPMPATKSLRQRIDELTAAPATKKTRRKKKFAGSTTQPGKGWTEAEKFAIAQAQFVGLGLYEVVVKIDPHCTMPIAARQLIQNAIGEIGQVLVVRPDAKSPAASKHVEFVLASAQSEAQIAARCHIPTIASECSVTIIHAASPSKAAEKAAKNSANEPVTPVPSETDLTSSEPAQASPAQVTPGSATSSPAELVPQGFTENILRVEAGRIDSVLNLVGELIIGKSMLQQALNEFAQRFPKEPLRGKFADAMGFQARVLNDLQRSVMKIRMVPVISPHRARCRTSVRTRSGSGTVRAGNRLG